MLNKRIKSLLAAGLVILGMGFAKVDSFAAEPLESMIENPTFDENREHQYSLQKGAIIINISYRRTNDYSIIVTYDDTKFTLKDVITYDVNNESLNNTSIFAGLKPGLSRDAETGKMVAKLSAKHSSDLAKLIVKYEPVDSDGNGIPDFKDSSGTDPEPDKITDPETGDASMIITACVAVASAAGLFVLSKKDDEE